MKLEIYIFLCYNILILIWYFSKISGLLVLKFSLRAILTGVIMKIQESGEMYLETIYLLIQQKGIVRSIDVATEMNYSKPSVSRAMGVLKKSGYILIDELGHITFTDKGLNKAKNIYDRHKTITKFLNNCLDIEIEQAEDEACRIEHVISDETFEKIKQYIKRCD